jgi:hypothetical protein
MKNKIATGLLLAATCFGIFSSAAMAQPISNFTSWTLTQDPLNALFGGASTEFTATLTGGNGTIPAGTDVGFASVNNTTVLNSTSGNYFSAASSISLAIDYNLNVTLPAGVLTSGIFIGFGIGEDTTGIDSAGVTLGVANFVPSPLLLLGATARVNDVTQPVGSIAGTANSFGTFFVSYDHVSGNVTVGAANTQNAATPTGSHTFAGIANDWDGENLLASFFMRSDNPSPAPNWTGTSAFALFSNFRVLSGAATTIPEPTTAALVLLGGLGILLRRRAVRA